jgi:hypothetical protein
MAHRQPRAPSRRQPVWRFFFLFASPPLLAAAQRGEVRCTTRHPTQCTPLRLADRLGLRIALHLIAGVRGMLLYMPL